MASYPERDLSSSSQEINLIYRTFKTNFNSSELAIYSIIQSINICSLFATFERVISSSSSNFLAFFFFIEQYEGFQAGCSSQLRGRGIRSIFYNVYSVGHTACVA